MKIKALDPGPRMADVFACYPDTDKCTLHAYDRAYDRLLAPFRNRPIYLLEIGVWRGDSLRAWAELFPLATIIGVDNAALPDIDRPRIRTYQADVNEPSTLTVVADRYGRFDIIIDDGPHDPFAQVTAWETLSPYLAPDGLYVIEDVQGPDIAADLAETVHGQIIDLRAIKGRYDDILVVCGGGAKAAQR